MWLSSVRLAGNGSIKIVAQALVVVFAMIVLDEFDLGSAQRRFTD